MDSGPGGSIGDSMFIADDQSVADVDQQQRDGELDREPDQAQSDADESAQQKQRNQPAGSQQTESQEFYHGFTLHEK